MKKDDIVFVGKVSSDDGMLLIEFPDLPGCQTFAPSLSGLLLQAKDAMLGWLVVSLMKGEGIPASKAKKSVSVENNHSWFSVSIPRSLLAAELLEAITNRKKRPT